MSSSLNIDPQTGLIQLTDVGAWEPGLKLVDFLATSQAEDAREYLSNQQHRWFKLELPPTSEFVVALMFLDERISEVRLAKKGATISWKDWSEEAEIKLKEEHDSLLEQILGVRPYKYFWGEIISIFDVSSGGNSVLIRYNQIQ